MTIAGETVKFEGWGESEAGELFGAWVRAAFAEDLSVRVI